MWRSSATQVNSYYIINSNTYFSCTNSYETYSAHFQALKSSFFFQSSHRNSFKEDIQTEETVEVRLYYHNLSKN